MKLPLAVLCRGADCEAAVMFVHSRKTGRNIMLDATPDPTGRVVLIEDGTKLFAISLTDEQLATDERERYADHHQTCPNAGDFRGGRRR